MNPRQAFERGREIFGTGAFAGESSLQMNQSGVKRGRRRRGARGRRRRRTTREAAVRAVDSRRRALPLHHSGEALKALNEAVRTAQQNGDEASLAHALAAFCALCASSSGSLASTEGAPAVEEWRAAGGDEGDKERRGVSISTQPPAVQAAADARLLLRRLAKQARTLRIPHLMAYGELARARHGASRPPCGPAPWSRGLETEGGSKKESGKTRDSDLSTADSALLFRRVASSPPAAAAAASQLVEALRHAVTLGAAAPQAATQAAAAAAAASRSGADGQRANPNELYPPPKGLALSAGYPSGSESAMEQLSGSGSVLFGAVWDAHGVPSMARMHALRHLRCDASRRFVLRDDETDADNDPGVVPGEFPESFGGSTRSSHEAEAEAPAAATTPPPRWRSSRGTRRRTTARTPPPTSSQSPPRDSQSGMEEVAATPRRRRRRD